MVFRYHLHSAGTRLCLSDCRNWIGPVAMVLSWEVSVTLDDDFCVNALKSALHRHKIPDIFNTKPGSTNIPVRLLLVH